MLARGQVGDRPFARFVYASASKSFRGDVVLVDQDQMYRTTWHEGLLVEAASPSPADAVGRVALKAGLLDATQLSELLRGLPPGLSQLDAIARHARLDEAGKSALARRALLQRGIRIFALRSANFEVHDQPSLAPAPGVTPIPVRAVIVRGLMGHYSEERLREELAVVTGARLKLAATDQSARVRLGEYGLSQGGLAVVQQLARTPATLDELVRALPEVASVELLATVYALLSADDLVAAVAPRSRRPAQTTGPLPTSPGARPVTRPVPDATAQMPATTQPTPAARPMMSQPVPTPVGVRPVTRPVPTIPAVSGPVPTVSGPVPTRAPRASTDAGPAGTSTGRVPRAGTQPGTDGSRAVPVTMGRPKRAGSEPLDVGDIQSLLEDTEQRAASGCTHYELLGVAPSATNDEIRSAYFTLAKKLHPDRVRGVGLTDKLRTAQHLFASINGAFNAINTPDKRAKYDATLASGGTGDRARDQAALEEKVSRLLSAEEHFFRGERALRMNRFAEALDEFRAAADKNPDEPSHHASLAWATWAAADDKKKVSASVEKGFRRALELSPKCITAHFYRGQIAAANGDTELALRYFRKVIELEPSHREAELQVRLLESRKNKKDSGGLFDRFRRR